jgi:hypothetical protein
MDKRIGKGLSRAADVLLTFRRGISPFKEKITTLAAIAFLISSFLVHAEPSVLLRVLDQEGHSLKEAGIGIPFLIEVEVASSTREEQQQPQLTIPPDLQVVRRGTSSTVRSINGETVIKNFYSYQAVTDQEGTFIIGPATIHLGKKHGEKSNTVTVVVGAEQKRSVENKRVDARVELRTTVSEPYVGQAVPFFIRFYAAHEGIHLEQLQEPLFKGFKHTALQGPATGTATIDGVAYQYLEWNATLFPTKEGRMVIPSLVAHLTVPVQNPRGRMDMFNLVNHMFGGGKIEQIYSNALTLQVKKLPAHERSVTAVGKFSSFHAKLSSGEAETGEGVSLTLELVGEGNFQMIGHPKLALPAGLKYYDSHAKDHALTDKLFKKDFEYVVQAVQPGEYEIPSQTFEYFDTKLQSYKTLQSRPVKLVVTGATRKSTVVDEEKEKREKEAVVTSEELPSLEKTLKGGGGLASTRISWLLFVCITFFLIVPLAWRILSFLWFTYQVRNASKISYNRAFKLARARIAAAKKAKNDPEIYHILMDLFANRLHMPRTELSEQDIETALKKAGLSDEKILEWRHFFSHVMAVTFSALPAEGDLYEQMGQWVMVLERLL